MLGSNDTWDGVRAVVAGFGESGAAAVDNLLHLGATVHAVAAAVPDDLAERAELLEVLGARIDVGEAASEALPADADVLVVSPGFATDAPIVIAAQARGIPVWGEVELAWRLRDPDNAAPWLCVTGTRGAGETARLLDAMLRAAGLRSAVAGTIDGGVGLPLTEAVMDPEGYDVLAVALSAAQLRWVDSFAAESAVVLHAGPDVDSELGRIYEGVERACVYNLADPATEDLVREADVVEGARAVGFTLGTPPVGSLGVVEDLLVDRGFVEQRSTSAAELGTLADLGPEPTPDLVAHALAAAALARAHGISQSAVRDGLRAFADEGPRGNA